MSKANCVKQQTFMVNTPTGRSRCIGASTLSERVCTRSALQPIVRTESPELTDRQLRFGHRQVHPLAVAAYRMAADQLLPVFGAIYLGDAFRPPPA